MNKTLISILIGIVIVASIGGLVFWQKNSSFDQLNDSDSISKVDDENKDIFDDDYEVDDFEEVLDGTVPPVNLPVQTGIITNAEVTGHASRQSCWSTINGNVYDLTSWIPKHPGGEQAILQLCGKDGSSKFTNKHGGNSKVLSVLFGFKIGIAE